MHPKLYLALALLILILVFVLQNTETVSIHFLFWQLSLSRALLVFSIFLCGLLGGYLLGSLAGHRRQEPPPRP